MEKYNLQETGADTMSDVVVWAIWYIQYIFGTFRSSIRYGYSNRGLNKQLVIPEEFDLCLAIFAVFSILCEDLVYQQSLKCDILIIHCFHSTPFKILFDGCLTCDSDYYVSVDVIV